LTDASILVFITFIMINRNLSKMVKAARKSQGLTQMDLQDLSEVSASVIHKIESGRDDLSLSSVVAVLGSLGIQIICKSPLGEEIQLNG
jgi:predicted transcriptional regulator